MSGPSNQMHVFAACVVLAAVSGCRRSGAQLPATERLDLDEAGMRGRCAGFDAGDVELAWTLYFRCRDGSLVVIGLNGRMIVGEGEPFALVYAQVIDGGDVRQRVAQRYPAEAFRMRADGGEVVVGPNRIRRYDDEGATHYAVTVDIRGEGQPTVQLEADLVRTADPWVPGSPTLIHRSEHGNCLEYVIPCPRADARGTLTIDGSRTALDGLAYFDSIRWLASKAPEPLRWHWGFLHSGADTLLIFDPSYAGARSLFLLWQGRQCVACDVGVELGARAPSLEGQTIAFAHGWDRRQVSLEVEVPARSVDESRTFLAPYTLVAPPRQPVRGHMVFEVGVWREF